MEKLVISTRRKCKFIRQGKERRKAVIAEVVYKTPVGKASNGKQRLMSESRHELQHFVD